jgi:hypothetical protein
MKQFIKLDFRISHSDDDIINFYESLEVKKRNQDFIETNIHLLQTHINTEQIINTLKLYKCKKGYTKVILDTTKVNNNWKKSKFHLTNYENLPYLNDKAKYLGSRKNLIDGNVIEPPTIKINNEGNIEFENGRNRFANLRDLGVKFIPFIICKKELNSIKECLRITS